MSTLADRELLKGVLAEWPWTSASVSASASASLGASAGRSTRAEARSCAHMPSRSMSSMPKKKVAKAKPAMAAAAWGRAARRSRRKVSADKAGLHGLGREGNHGAPCGARQAQCARSGVSAATLIAQHGEGP